MADLTPKFGEGIRNTVKTLWKELSNGAHVLVRGAVLIGSDGSFAGTADKPLITQNAAGSATIGTVAQGAAGAAAWPVAPRGGIIEGGLTELIDKDDAEISLNDLTKSVSVALAETCSGEIVQVFLTTLETGTGAVKTPTGVLFFFDADPTISASDAAMTAAERATVIGQVDISSAWDSDANGASISVPCSVHFHNLATLYLAFRNTGAAINDAANDDEEMSVNFHYVRAS